MKLSLEAVSEFNQIHSYDDNNVVIRPQHQDRLDAIETNFILTADTLIRDWAVSDIQQLSAAQVAELQRLDPEVILFATGSGLTVEHQKIAQLFIPHHIGVEFMDLGPACRTFNLLVTEQRKVLLAVCFQSV
ncbi:Mth938-like domain-containing protein [Methylophaga thiooxydans]|uniref:Mth938-like domain-containing protein n=1 Tax=Methylophaga thiooxydans DMS010 TaxID=637616 RepID=C0N504_9GAMM|nr:MTH938/NDUFAF3 family protein [Methylophaga thiooxydans]EEF80084.1 conserved hypothetical protein [Methylophaga thiooxydans DMS010]